MKCLPSGYTAGPAINGFTFPLKIIELLSRFRRNPRVFWTAPAVGLQARKRALKERVPHDGGPFGSASLPSARCAERPC